MEATRRELFVMPDYGAFPVWSDRGGFMVRPDSLPISEELRQGLQGWCDRWDDVLSSSWYEMPEDFPRDQWLAEGRELAQRLGHELRDSADVVFFADEPADG